MEIRLEQPVEELVPVLIAWNNQELMAQTEEALAKYKDMVYTDETMNIAKKDRATLNKFATALNSERLRIGKIYQAPYDKFKGEVDEVVGKVKEVVGAIDIQVKQYEDDLRTVKEEKIKELFYEKIGAHADFIPYEKVAQDKWLNATTTFKSIEQDIDTIVTNANNAMVAIEALNAGEDETTIKAHYYRTLDLAVALKAHSDLQEERRRIAEYKKAQERAREVSNVSTPNEVQNAVEAEIEPVVEMLELNFKVVCTEEQAKGLKAYLKSNQIKYEAI